MSHHTIESATSRLEALLHEEHYHTDVVSEIVDLLHKYPSLCSKQFAAIDPVADNGHRIPGYDDYFFDMQYCFHPLAYLARQNVEVSILRDIWELDTKRTHGKLLSMLYAICDKPSVREETLQWLLSVCDDYDLRMENLFRSLVMQAYRSNIFLSLTTIQSFLSKCPQINEAASFHRVCREFVETFLSLGYGEETVKFLIRQVSFEIEELRLDSYLSRVEFGINQATAIQHILPKAKTLYNFCYPLTFQVGGWNLLMKAIGESQKLVVLYLYLPSIWLSIKPECLEALKQLFATKEEPANFQVKLRGQFWDTQEALSVHADEICLSHILEGLRANKNRTLRFKELSLQGFANINCHLIQKLAIFFREIDLYDVSLRNGRCVAEYSTKESTLISSTDCWRGLSEFGNLDRFCSSFELRKSDL